MLALLVHTLFDGIAIASGFLVSRSLGMVIFLAIFLHKIPEGFTVGSVMLASGKSRVVAFGAAMGLGGATLLGVLAMNTLQSMVGVGLPLSLRRRDHLCCGFGSGARGQPGASLMPALAFFFFFRRRSCGLRPGALAGNLNRGQCYTSRGNEDRSGYRRARRATAQDP